MRLRLLSALGCGFGMLLPWVAAAGQTDKISDAKKLQFEVASVRENKSDEKSSSNFPLNPGPQYADTGGVLRAHNTPLIQVLVFAYVSSSWQIQTLRQGLPEWTRGVRYDIDAKAPGSATKDEMRAMMRSLLEERFGVRMHKEMRETNVFALEMVKPGKLGPQISLHAVDDPECKRRPLAETASGGYPHQCGTTARIQSGPGLDAIGGQNVAMDYMVLGFTDPGSGVDRAVINRTGLTGRYDFTLEWAPAPSDPAAPVNDAGLGFYEALKEELGMRLVPAKGPVEFLLLDKIERPAEN